MNVIILSFCLLLFQPLQFLLCPLRLPVHLCLALTKMLAIMLRHLSTYLSALVQMVEIAYRLDIVVHSIVDDMYVRKLFVRMQYGHVLGIFDAHLFPVFPCVFRHLLYPKFCPVLVAPAKHGMPYGIANLWAHFLLCVEVVIMAFML